MTDRPNNNVSENSWNPFISTKRDIARTDDLASKNAALAGLLSFFFAPAGLIYLNRGINTLKILGYVFAASLVFGMATREKESSKDLGNLVSLLGTGAITAEQVMAVNKARQRQEKKPSALVSSFERIARDTSGLETNKEAVKLLKQLKEKHEANEISEEEFKRQKQQVLESM